jgi:glycosyltransferase involved in cell wall biosynthesis
MSRAAPTFSIIIPTYARPGRVRACLGALCELDYPAEKFEVIVVDDGSPTPPAAEVADVAEQIDVKLITRGNGGPGAARNPGAQCARGDFIAVTADDCAPQADWLTKLAARFAAEPDRIIGGAIENTLPNNPYSNASHLLIEYLYSSYNRQPDRARFFTPNNLAVPARLFRSMGGFNPHTGSTGEDREFCARWLARGHAMTFAPDVVVRHKHPLDFAGFCRQQFSYGVGSGRYRKLTRASESTGVFTPQPLRFYFDLMRYPLAKQGACKSAIAAAALLAIGQFANAAGVLIEQFRPNEHASTESSPREPALERQ